MRVLAISGSLRKGSYNTMLLAEAARLAPSGVDVDIFGGLEAVQPFNEDREGAPGEGVLAFRQAVESADVVIIATPEYNFSIPGQLKNAVDWASRPTVATGVFAGKAVVIISSSTSAYGGQWSQEELRKAVGAAGARVIELEKPIALIRADRAFSDDGRLKSERTVERLSAMWDQVLADVHQLQNQPV